LCRNGKSLIKLREIIVTKMLVKERSFVGKEIENFFLILKNLKILQTPSIPIYPQSDHTMMYHTQCHNYPLTIILFHMRDLPLTDTNQTLGEPSAEHITAEGSKKKRKR